MTEIGNASGSAEFPLGENVGNNPGAPKDPSAPKGWYSRGFLPHRDEIGLLQSITIRLADSLPQSKLCELDEELVALPEDKREILRRIEIEKWLDAGTGCCALRHPAVAEIVQNAFFHADGLRYHLLAWCIMPNHVHVLIRPLVSLPRIVQAWKGFTGNWAMSRNADLNLGIPGPRFWQREMWDRYIRDTAHLNNTIKYIHENPVKARLCQAPEDWPWSSASFAAVGSIAGKNPNSPGNAISDSGNAKFPLGA